MEKLLNEAKAIAYDAGDILRGYAMHFTDEERASPSPETMYDRLLGAYITQNLEKVTGIPAFYEGMDNAWQRQAVERFWWVDPIDGTSSLIRGEKNFGISIGLIDRQRPRAGLIYQPHAEVRKLYTGLENGAASLEIAQVEEICLSVPMQDSPQLRVIMGTSSELVVGDIYRALGGEFVDPLGSITAKMGLIAEGKADLYLRLKDWCNEWDTAGGEPVLLAAGGQVTDLNGTSLRYNKRNPKYHGGIVFSSRTDHQEICRKIRVLIESVG